MIGILRAGTAYNMAMLSLLATVCLLRIVYTAEGTVRT